MNNRIHVPIKVKAVVEEHDPTYKYPAYVMHYHDLLSNTEKKKIFFRKAQITKLFGEGNLSKKCGVVRLERPAFNPSQYYNWTKFSEVEESRLRGFINEQQNKNRN